MPIIICRVCQVKLQLIFNSFNFQFIYFAGFYNLDVFVKTTTVLKPQQWANTHLPPAELHLKNRLLHMQQPHTKGGKSTREKRIGDERKKEGYVYDVTMNGGGFE